MWGYALVRNVLLHSGLHSRFPSVKEPSFATPLGAGPPFAPMLVRLLPEERCQGSSLYANTGLGYNFWYE